MISRFQTAMSGKTESIANAVIGLFMPNFSIRKSVIYISVDETFEYFANLIASLHTFF